MLRASWEHQVDRCALDTTSQSTQCRHSAGVPVFSSRYSPRNIIHAAKERCGITLDRRHGSSHHCQRNSTAIYPSRTIRLSRPVAEPRQMARYALIQLFRFVRGTTRHSNHPPLRHVRGREDQQCRVAKRKFALRGNKSLPQSHPHFPFPFPTMPTLSRGTSAPPSYTTEDANAYLPRGVPCLYSACICNGTHTDNLLLHIHESFLSRKCTLMYRPDEAGQSIISPYTHRIRS